MGVNRHSSVDVSATAYLAAFIVIPYLIAKALDEIKKP
jgi:hypothetical protein